MSRSSRTYLAALLGLLFSLSSSAVPSGGDSALWTEFGLVNSQDGKAGQTSYTAYRMRDLTGALAAWEWQRSPQAQPCNVAAFCTTDGKRTLLLEDNYLLVFDGSPKGPAVSQVIATLPSRRATELPAILTFVPRDGLVPNSARYVLGDASLQAFSPELAATAPGFAEGAEAQVAQYKLSPTASPVKLALFYYPTPEMARLHSAKFKAMADLHVKRSGVLLAVVYGNASQADADTLLARIEYQAKITWNETPPPSPIKPMYQLLVNIIYLSVLLTAICLAAGLIYAGMRIYRRRYGQLEANEAMTTLHLTGD